MDEMMEYIDRQREWSIRTFGPGRRTVGICKHIRKEIKEVLAEPESLEEWVDIIILAIDGAWRAGYMPEAIIAGLQAKQTINIFNRQWPPVEAEDMPTEHIREDCLET
ncbi:MAG: dATP/dGTP pyrophosphohydrolase domain-containing protein [bacterium]